MSAKRIGYPLVILSMATTMVGFAVGVGAASQTISRPPETRPAVALDTSTTVSTALGYEYLNSVMDKFNHTVDVYTDADSGGNHYIPSGWMGDWADVTFASDSTATVPHSGLTSVRIRYSAEATQGNRWAGIYWQHPENNWGDLTGGLDLRGASQLTFWGKKEDPGDGWVDFKVGGINRIPNDDPAKPDRDAFGPIGTGYVRLSDEWQRFTIPLDKDYFDVYRDQHVANGFAPSGSMGDLGDITFTDTYTVNPYAGRTAIRIDYSAAGPQGWSGIYWQCPANAWGDSPAGLDLAGFTRLTFKAHGRVGGEQVEFFAFGIGRDPLTGTPTKPYYDSSPKTSLGYVSLDSTWTTYSIDLTGKDLSRVIGGFGWATNRSRNANGATFYLDDIRYERSLSPSDLNSTIGGFAWATDKASNPDGVTFYLDDIQFDKARPNALRLLTSFELRDPDADKPLGNVAFTYDNALAMLSYMARGTADDWRRAKIIGDTLIYAQDHDPDYDDGRLRNAYRSGDITDTSNGDALLPGWWDDTRKRWLEDPEAVSSTTGNIAWAMIALLDYYENKGDPAYLEAARRMGEWVETETRDDSVAIGGYMGGYRGWPSDPPQKQTWKSTEHNIDLYVAFRRLHTATGNTAWVERANHAKRLVEAMWDSDSGRFWTGTLGDGTTTNTANIPVDIQAWAVLAFPEKLEYRQGLAWAEANARTDCAVHDCPNHSDARPGFSGFDFNDDLDGIWFEGTAQMVTAYRAACETEAAGTYLRELRRAQVSAENSDGRGIVAACHDGVTTGFDLVYLNRLHVGATSWFIMAARSFNPYWPDRTKPFARASAPRYSTDQSKTRTFRVGWTASDATPTMGIASYEVQRKDGSLGAWTDWKNDTTQTSGIFSGTVGHTYHFRVRATDWTDNQSTWSPPVATVVPFDQDVATYSARMWASTSATSSQLYLGTARSTTRPGARAVYRFNGRQVILFVTEGPDRGKARVRVDGGAWSTFDTYAPSTRFRQAAWAWPRIAGNANEVHTVTIENLATARRPRLELDAIGVRR
ncbi:MAG: hypothetical protein WC971_07930 [Coriobacteriia bacterium]